MLHNALFSAWKQLCFFKKAVKSLEAVEPHVKLVTEQQHIDYQFSGLDDREEYDYDDDDGDDDDDDYYDDDDEEEEEDDDDDGGGGGGGGVVRDNGELSFDYRQDDQEHDVSTSQKPMEVTLFPSASGWEILNRCFSCFEIYLGVLDKIKLGNQVFIRTFIDA